MSLELRMYGLVPYQLMGIQQGIQYGHSTDEFALKVIKSLMGKSNEIPKEDIEKYLDWLENWKTYIVLNGGTTNNRIVDHKYVGSLNNHKETLDKNGIFNVSFNEPDLGDQLTGVVFIVDERVFLKDENKKYVYLEFEDWIFENRNPYVPIEHNEKWLIKTLRKRCKESNDQNIVDYYNKWVDYMGGEKNVFLREFLKDLRMA
jgi:hypothetical protein